MPKRRKLSNSTYSDIHGTITLSDADESVVMLVKELKKVVLEQSALIAEQKATIDELKENIHKLDEEADTCVIAAPRCQCKLMGAGKLQVCARAKFNGGMMLLDSILNTEPGLIRIILGYLSTEDKMSLLLMSKELRYMSFQALDKFPRNIADFPTAKDFAATMSIERRLASLKKIVGLFTSRDFATTGIQCPHITSVSMYGQFYYE